jgi:hypothetical protein
MNTDTTATVALHPTYEALLAEAIKETDDWMSKLFPQTN